ncbi:MAG: DPP IV N-terminal domain-containing protein [Kiritimatiellota bacterium]|nr:DPP IV N-terminal domain-containing protein [Kiritimatiellota bacterium]
MKRWGWIAFLVFFSVLSVAPAQVRVTKAMNEVSSLDIAQFVGQSGGAPTVFRQTLEADLKASGWFNLAGGGRAEFSLLGEAAMSGASLEVRCEAYNVASREKLLGKTYKTTDREARRLAHKVADDIVLALTGQKGMASTRILLIGNRTGKKEVYLCDADGQNLRQLTRDNTISMAPKWSPDGSRFVYTSFRSQFPDVYLVNLNTGDRKCIANYPGLNASAAFSADGSEVALILSKDGNPDLYVKDLAGGALTRLTSTRRAAEASPAWSPDGRQIVFVSDRSGTPQLYVMDRSGGEPRRLTSRGSQNVDPDWGANGYIAYCSYIGGSYQIFVMNPATMEFKQVTREDANYEDPSWAPDGRHIVCTRTVNYRSRIFMIDTLGGSLIPLLPDSERGDWVAPNWSKQ